jgi:ribosomal protein L11 methyltransferase
MQNELIIAAGGAFGSGAHPSTALALEALQGIALAEGNPIRRILDVGAGSGILSIAAARLIPEARIIASDINPESASFIRHNAELNGVAAAITALRADGIDHPTITSHAPYDLVLCNISAEAILPMLHAFTSLTSGGGLLVLSGIQSHQGDMLAEAVRQAGLSVVTILAKGSWCAMIARHE